MSVVAGNRHQWVELCLFCIICSVSDVHADSTHLVCDGTASNVLQHVVNECLIHIHSTYIVVLVDGTEILLQLHVADVATIVVVTFWVTMTHECHDAISHSSLDV